MVGGSLVFNSSEILTLDETLNTLSWLPSTNEWFPANLALRPSRWKLAVVVCAWPSYLGAV